MSRMVPRTLPEPEVSVRYPRDGSRSTPPCRLAGVAGGRARRHVPDFLLGLRGATVRVVNVKPAGRLADPKIAEALAWPGELFRAHGWDYQGWAGEGPVRSEEH